MFTPGNKTELIFVPETSEQVDNKPLSMWNTTNVKLIFVPETSEQVDNKPLSMCCLLYTSPSPRD